MRWKLVCALVLGLMAPAAAPAQECTFQTGWVKAENAKAGNKNWDSDVVMRFSADFTRRKEVKRVEGYFDQTSIGCGQSATLKIVGAKSAAVSLYRIGYYKGAGARLIKSF